MMEGECWSGGNRMWSEAEREGKSRGVFGTPAVFVNYGGLSDVRSMAFKGRRV